jgi:hypothetical protein
MAYPKGSTHPKLVGDRTTAHVLARVLEVYDSAFIPFGENQRYDLVIEDGDEFIRIQCKTGRLIKGAVVFQTCSQNYHHPNRDPARPYRQNYRGQADYFGVHCPETDDVYLVPVDVVGVRACSLRVDHPANGQTKRIRWAKDYQLPRVEAAKLFPADRLEEAVPLRPV